MKGIGKININGNKILGIEINVLGEGNARYSAVLLSISKGKVKVEEKKENAYSTEELSNLLKGNIPVSISITGKGLIHRKVEEEIDEGNSAAILNKVFPNTSEEDFYFQYRVLSDRVAYFSLIRHELLNDILEQFRKFKIHIIELNLGPVAIKDILPHLRQNELKIHTSYNLISLNQNFEIVSFTSKHEDNISDSYLIGDERVSSNEIVAYATAFQCMLINDFKNDSSYELIDSYNKEFHNYRLFRILGLSVLGFFFALLLVNYFVFDSYNKRQNELTKEVGKFNSLLAQSEKFENELKDKRGLLEETGLLLQSKLTFYADRIISIMPPRIVLTEFSINPVMQSKLKDKKIEFDKNSILIKGLIKNTTDINIWMKEIRYFEWVNKINVVSYNKEEDTQSGEFILEVKIN